TARAGPAQAGQAQAGAKPVRRSEGRLTPPLGAVRRGISLGRRSTSFGGAPMLLMMRLKPLFGRSVTRVWLFTSAVAATSACIWVFNLQGPEAPGRITIPWWGLAGAFYVAEAWVVHLHFRKQAHTLSLAEIGIVLGLFFATPGGLLAAQLVGAGTALVVHRRPKPGKVAFNPAEQSLRWGLALMVFQWLVGPDPSSLQTWAAALTAAAAAHIAGVLLVSAVIAVAEGHFAAPQLGRTLSITLVG